MMVTLAGLTFISTGVAGATVFHVKLCIKRWDRRSYLSYPYAPSRSNIACTLYRPAPLWVLPERVVYPIFVTRYDFVNCYYTCSYRVAQAARSTAGRALPRGFSYRREFWRARGFFGWGSGSLREVDDGPWRLVDTVDYVLVGSADWAVAELVEIASHAASFSVPGVFTSLRPRPRPQVEERGAEGHGDKCLL